MDDNFWEDAALRDPLWAILSDPTRRGRRWDVGAFFETGRREISLVLYQLRQLDRMPRTGRALDFGCGVGRLTQALVTTFAEVVGVDVSPTMISLANELNRHPGIVTYLLNQSPTLALLPSDHFDFVYSDIVLQHLEPASAQIYIADFLRLLARRGVAVFQLPSHRRAAEEVSRPVAMAGGAYRAGLVVVNAGASAVDGGASRIVTVDVQNHSNWTWDQAAAGPIRLGNHWRNLRGDMIVQDDGRMSLPAVMPPGAAERLSLTIHAPCESGHFVCELDLVHEGISWFADMGSTPVHVPVQINSQAPAGRNSESNDLVQAPERIFEFPDIHARLPEVDATDIGEFPMYGVPRELVLELIHSHGGELFFLEEDERGGPEWRGYRYFVAKV